MVEEQLSDQNETIVSLSLELEKLRKDYDECDKENLILKCEISHLKLLGTKTEMALVYRLIKRLQKYEPDFKP